MLAFIYVNYMLTMYKRGNLIHPTGLNNGRQRQKYTAQPVGLCLVSISKLHCFLSFKPFAPRRNSF